MIFMYINFDKCRKEIIRYEEKRNTNNMGMLHPKGQLKEATDVLRCYSKNLSFEPVCLEAFNDARECLFRLDCQLRVCEPELNLFEECVYDPKRFAKFKEMATPGQRVPKDYFATIQNKNYFV